MQINRYQVIVFDLDGTLVDSVPDLSLAINHALAVQGWSDVQENEVREWVGNGSLKLAERTLESLNLLTQENLEALHGQFLQSYKKFLCEKSVLYSGVKPLLRNLKDQNKVLVVLTNKPMAFVPELLAKLEIADYFDWVLGGDSFEKKKPDPLPMVKILQHYNIAANQCLMVGDSRSDVVCAQQANVDSVALLQGYHQGIDLASLKPTYLFADMAEFAQTVI